MKRRGWLEAKFLCGTMPKVEIEIAQADFTTLQTGSCEKLSLEGTI